MVSQWYDTVCIMTERPAVVRHLRAQLADEGAVWGIDCLDHQFANDRNGYLAQRNGVAGSLDATTNLADYYPEQLRNAANIFEQSDTGLRPDI
jgi:hypothetical protein